MANDFSGDPNCKALWRFESGALTVDDIGSNTLTDENTVAESTGAGGYAEGSCAADFEYNNSERFYITDANLDAGYPLKSGDTNKIFSICYWFKVESYNASATYYAAAYAKRDATTKLSIQLAHYDPTNKVFGIRVGYGTGGAFQTISIFTGINTGQLYHVALVLNDADRSYAARLWNGSTTSDASGNYSNYISVTDGQVSIGGVPTSQYFDGIIDEMVVFSDELTSDEIDAIRSGMYGTAKGAGQFTSLSLMATPGMLHSFSAKTPAGGFVGSPYYYYAQQ